MLTSLKELMLDAIIDASVFLILVSMFSLMFTLTH
jgi:hypothetical protein